MDKPFIIFIGTEGLKYWDEVLKQDYFKNMSKGKKMPKPTKGGKGKGKC